MLHIFTVPAHNRCRHTVALLYSTSMIGGAKDARIWLSSSEYYRKSRNDYTCAVQTGHVLGRLANAISPETRNDMLSTDDITLQYPWVRYCFRSSISPEHIRLRIELHKFGELGALRLLITVLEHEWRKDECIHERAAVALGRTTANLAFSGWRHFSTSILYGLETDCTDCTDETEYNTQIPIHL
jgi:hypothetical protein